MARNSVETGIATVPVAPVGVSPTGFPRTSRSPNNASSHGSDVFGGTPKTAGETPAIPKSTIARWPRLFPLVFIRVHSWFKRLFLQPVIERIFCKQMRGENRL